MEKILGIDTGTNSLGWAIVEKTEDGYKLLEKGVSIFQEGVGKSQSGEYSRAAERTKIRRIRIGYYRTRLRKIRLLRVLVDNHLCPPLSPQDLSNWRLHKAYPSNELFMQWQQTDDEKGANPYRYRHLCLNEKLDLTDITQRYILGRALYHINQRRGFLSNRKNPGDDSEGKVKEGISELSKQMEEQGYEYLGDYFYHLYSQGKKIRKHYTARNEHYLKEFHAICEKQELGAELMKKLEKAIFASRSPQKGQVGRCPFEKKKSKCPISHPLFEEFRMLSFINNIKIQTPQDNSLRPLNKDERAVAESLFYRKSKGSFEFDDIAKKIAGKGKYGFIKDGKDKGKPYLFNFPMDTSVPGSIVTAQLKDIFGQDWKSAICEVFLSRANASYKTEFQKVNDVWHALFSYDKEEGLIAFAKKHLQMNEEEAKKFAAIKMPSGYAALSVKALCKILPYLRTGMKYSHAVLLANLGEVVPTYEWNNPQMREVIIDDLTTLIDNCDSTSDSLTMEACIKGYLKERFHVDDKTLKNLYHPSMIEVYPHARPGADGIYQLGSPCISSVRNPMAMRALFQLRRLVNRLLKEGKIDAETTIHIEFARELNDANKRAALREYERNNQKAHEEARKGIVSLYQQQTGKTIEPTEEEITRYLLWEEQDHRCLYTGNSIGITDFVGPDPKYDIEHTIPRSRGGDSTMMNLTLCEKSFNRDVKKTKLPSELSNHEEILERIASWKERYEEADKRVRKLKHGAEAKKEDKDKRIRNRHRFTMERNYWRGKYERFEMKKIPEGFSRRQGVDIGIISRYARLYLKSVFNRVFTVKGIATSDFRKIWGLQEIYEKKERVNHAHHCIDAIVIACIGPHEYSDLARYYHDEENHRWYGLSKAHFPKPWPKFVEDIKAVQEKILVSHHTPDNIMKQGRKHIKVNGKMKLSICDAARVGLHEDTVYGAITMPTSGDFKYVIRKQISDLKESDVDNIVDKTVKAIVKRAIAEKGFAKAKAEVIWMNEEKQIPIKKVRCVVRNQELTDIRKHRDLSTKEYKQWYHVDKGENYLMAVYEGIDKRGRRVRNKMFVTNLEAARYYRTSNKAYATQHPIVPEKDENGYILKYILKKGTLLLLYEASPDEIWNGSKKDLSKRLYKVTSLEKDGRVQMTFHEEARPTEDLKNECSSKYQASSASPKLRIQVNGLNALVEGQDFKINEIGEIERLR